MAEPIKPRPIGREGDFVTREEVNARINNANSRTALFAASLDVLRTEAKQRDEDLDRELRKLALLMGQRIRALEARTLPGRITALKTWLNERFG